MSHQPRRGFSIDTVAGFLDRTVFSVTGASVAIVAAFLCTAEKCDGLLSFISWFDKARGPSSVAWPRYLACFIAAKTVNRALNRLVLNHGWKADKPVWSHVKGEGDIVLVTGGSSGIGRCVIDMLAEKTTNIVSLDIVAPEDAPAHFKHYQCDITDPEAVAKAAEAIRKEYGNPTILFNNAGMSNGRTLLNTSSERFLLTFKVNVLGPFNILHEFLPHIVSINHGHIVTTCSAAAFSGTAQMGDYCASKAASLSLYETLTHELDCRYNARRVRTSIVLPAKTRTPLSTSLAEAENQFISPTLTPEQVARRMVDYVESGLGGHSIMPGSASTLLPLVRFMPFWYGWLFSKVAKTRKLVTDELVDEKERVYKPTRQLHQLHGIESH